MVARPAVLAAAALAAGLAATPAPAADAVARLDDRADRPVGQVLLSATPHGTLLRLHRRDHRTSSSTTRLFDDDGAAVVLHAGPDDYVTDPAGAAGARIACGVITR